MTICGDGLLKGEEECDDGNTDEDDNCSNTCTPLIYEDSIALRKVFFFIGLAISTVSFLIGATTPMTMFLVWNMWQMILVSMTMRMDMHQRLEDFLAPFGFSSMDLRFIDFGDNFFEGENDYDVINDE